jgi:hypothetical protein
LDFFNNLTTLADDTSYDTTKYSEPCREGQQYVTERVTNSLRSSLRDFGSPSGFHRPSSESRREPLDRRLPSDSRSFLGLSESKGLEFKGPLGIQKGSSKLNRRPLQQVPSEFGCLLGLQRALLGIPEFPSGTLGLYDDFHDGAVVALGSSEIPRDSSGSGILEDFCGYVPGIPLDSSGFLGIPLGILLGL